MWFIPGWLGVMASSTPSAAKAAGWVGMAACSGGALYFAIMSNKFGFRGAYVLFGGCLSVGVVACHGQVATAIPANQAQAAVELVAKLYTVNALAKMDAKGSPLPKTGTWAVRVPHPEERIADCDLEGVVCVEVVYRAGQPEVVCAWTVLFPAGGGPPKVVSDNEESATYMLRVFKKDDKDRPADRKQPPPVTLPIVKIVHMTGVVKMNVIVDVGGKVVGEFVLDSPNQAFTESAINNVKDWHMTPYSLNGKPRPYSQETAIHIQ